VTGKQDTILAFRKIISSRYAQYSWIAGLSMAVCFALGWFLREFIFPFSFFLSAGVACLIFCIDFYRHRKKMLDCFTAQHEYPDALLEEYIQKKKGFLLNRNESRIIIGTVLALAMIFSILFLSESHWARIIAGWFICFILAIMIKGWIDFRESILLHDIKRSLRDQPSDISD
jgi:hypothetical protein